jgi:hypothetical protein
MGLVSYMFYLTKEEDISAKTNSLTSGANATEITFAQTICLKELGKSITVHQTHLKIGLTQKTLI